MYFLKIFLLKDCPYCISTKELLKNIKNLNIIDVDNNEKEKYKTKLISTFPQIYLKKDNSKGSLLLGGYSDLKFVLDLLNKENDIKIIQNKFKKKYKSWSKKAILRLVQILTI
jgi:glutaredoxin